MLGCGLLAGVGTSLLLFVVLGLLETHAFRSLEAMVLGQVVGPTLLVGRGAAFVLAGLYGTISSALRS